MARRATIAFLICFNVALGILVIYLQSRAYHSPGKEAQPIEYKDFISILLTGLAVMIAVATIVLAAAAIWGFEALRKEAKASAENVARETATAVATVVAKDVAATVAARTARDVEPSDTSPVEASELVEALAAEEANNAG
jgi:heme/copper-type cytochrome/quinol oxidase subunit 2